MQVVAGVGCLGYRGQRFGASPSGKAADFDSAIRRFDPSRPSQSLWLELISHFEWDMVALDKTERVVAYQIQAA